MTLRSSICSPCRGAEIGDDGARAIAGSSLASSLEHLAIASAFLTVEGLDALLNSALATRNGSIHVEEEDQTESLVPSLMSRFHDETTFERFLQHPALTAESREELRYQWDLVMSN